MIKPGKHYRNTARQRKHILEIAYNLHKVKNLALRF